MDGKVMDKLASGMILAGLGFLIHAVAKMPDAQIQQVKGMIEGGDAESVKAMFADGHAENPHADGHGEHAEHETEHAEHDAEHGHPEHHHAQDEHHDEHGEHSAEEHTYMS